MLRRNLSRLAVMLLLSGSVISLPAIAEAQDEQSQSIADAARRSREQRKNSAKSTKVITDDDLDTKSVKPGQQGVTLDAKPKLETGPPSPEAVTDAVAAERARAATTAKKPTDDPEIARLKSSIADAEKELDLLKRSLTLEQDTYFSNPDYAHDTAGKARLDGLQRQISDKQQEIERMKARLAELQKRHPAPPTPPIPSEQPTPPQQP
ncbi:MAG TPA: hypothetical protein VOA64_03280 [Candidatus Dormibacteraeota bacterium]|nr:hypothetical protein [Candidatus Dormibacteraeota bacterium]